MDIVGNGHGDLSSNFEAVCMSHRINSLKKDINPADLPPDLGKIVWQPVQEKENSEFKTVKIC